MTGGWSRWLDPYGPKFRHRYVAVVVRSVSVILAVSVGYWWAYSKFGFEATVSIAVWWLLVAEFAGPNPYTFRKRVQRVLDREGSA